MIKYRMVFAALFASAAIAGLCSNEAKAIRSMDNHLKDQAVPLLSLLAKMGEAYNCYFTVEAAWTNGEPANQMESYLIFLPQDKKDLRSTLEYLQQKVPNFTYIANSSNRRIFHIIDARLSKQEGYGLTHVLKSVRFSGLVRDLPDFINKQGATVGKAGMIDTRDASVQDFSTTVKVQGQNLQVRSLLSNYLPLEKRDRIIWIARTKLGKGEISQVQFRSVAIHAK